MENLDIELRKIAYLIRELFDLEQKRQKQMRSAYDLEAIGYPCGLRRRNPKRI